MKKKLNNSVQRRCALSKKHSKVVIVHNSKDSVEYERIEWLKQLYIQWQRKHKYILNSNNEIYIINEPEELDIEGYW